MLSATSMRLMGLIREYYERSLLLTCTVLMPSQLYLGILNIVVDICNIQRKRLSVAFLYSEQGFSQKLVAKVSQQTDFFVMATLL